MKPKVKVDYYHSKTTVAMVAEIDPSTGLANLFYPHDETKIIVSKCPATTVKNTEGHYRIYDENEPEETPAGTSAPVEKAA
jgi:hypothetical protein